MVKEIVVVVLGLLVAVLPFLGFPSSWRTPMFALMGLAIAALGFLIRNEVRTAKGSRARLSHTQSVSPLSHDVYQKAQNPFGEGQEA